MGFGGEPVHSDIKCLNARTYNIGVVAHPFGCRESLIKAIGCLIQFFVMYFYFQQLKNDIVEKIR